MCNSCVTLLYLELLISGSEYLEMSLSDDDIEMALRITKRMMSKGVLGSHHKQPQSIAGWFPVHERGDVKDVLDDMCSDTSAPVRKKGRGTVQLTSWQDAVDFLNDNGEDPPDRW